MSAVTNRIARYVADKGISIKKISDATGIPYQPLQVSLSEDRRDRSLRDDELIKVCVFLEKDPMEFADIVEANT